MNSPIKNVPSELRPLIIFLFYLALMIVALFIVGWIIDYLRKDHYQVNKYYYRTLNSNIGGGEEYYYRYWAWQPYKKKFYKQILSEKQGINRTYSRKAIQRRKLKKSPIPFRREIYGKAK
ncbi:hypothetical protein [Enterococcus sp. CWB-B31]|uniref:hypothetical protein n=1 Tax=Enterococcus sp. CWB-B31 TaxID=2885159 RepID=UPI001E63DC01|nr:hypothetical protein [Enterococcus sp. CWB-B31]MCB5953716.1 hypothetical protein [Enterococcus sp. CWB-B31]